MDSSPAVVEFLRKTSKGKLQYDLHGNDRTLRATVEEFIKRENSLKFAQQSAIINEPTENDKPHDEKNHPNNQRKNQINSERPKLAQIDVIDVKELEDTLLFTQYEAERQQATEKLKAQRKMLWAAECQHFANNAQKQLEIWNQQKILNRKQQYENELIFLSKRKLKVQQMQDGMKESNERRKKFFSDEIKKLELKQKQIEQQNIEKLEALQRQQELRNSLVECQRQINFKSNKIVEILKSRDARQHISQTIQQIICKQRGVVEAINQLVSEKREKPVVENDLHNAQFLVQQVEENLQNLATEMEKEILAASATSVAPPTVVVPTAPTTPTLPTAPAQSFVNPATEAVQIQQPPSIAISEEAKEFEIYQYITPESMKEYARIQKVLLQYTEGCMDLANDNSPRITKYKFALKKAINIPVNAISPYSGSHLRDKLVRLKTLLQGQAVDVGNDQRASTNEHPQALAWTKDELAKKFAVHGDLVSSKPESAFVIAAVIIGVWAEIPDFGDLFLAHLHKRCPYTVPYYVAKEENQAQDDYDAGAEGNVCSDGGKEKQHKFLNQMSGLVRLYAAVISSPMPREFNKPHPYNLENGWKWLTRVLNLEPRPDVTATILLAFLEAAGSAMQRTYGSQFNKLLAVLCQNYLPKIRQVTASGSIGILNRLESFLQISAQRNAIAPPKGLLSERFWYE